MSSRSRIPVVASLIVPRAGLLVGTGLGLLLGWYGVFAGGLLGALVDVLRSQRAADHDLVSWLENPGAIRIAEPVPGIVAFSALAVVLLAENRRRGRGRLSTGLDEAAIVWKVGVLASTLSVALPEQRALLENYARVAASLVDSLNSDLLVESLAARRKSRGDVGSWLSLLAPLCDSVSARRLFDRLVRNIDPLHQLNDSEGFSRGAGWRTGEGAGEEDLEREAWTIMGLPAGTGRSELSRVYRSLARQFHPDTLHGLDAEHLRQAANAFLRIDGAYRKLSQRPKAGLSSPVGTSPQP